MDDLVSTTLNNGVRIPLLGFSPEMKGVSLELLNTAYGAGYRHFIVQAKGPTDDIVAGVVREWLHSSATDREELFISVKLSITDPKKVNIKSRVAQDVYTIGCDYIDLLIIDFDQVELKETPKSPVLTMREEETIDRIAKSLDAVVEDGSVRATGLSCTDVHKIDSILCRCQSTFPQVLQINYMKAVQAGDIGRIQTYCKYRQLQLMCQINAAGLTSGNMLPNNHQYLMSLKKVSIKTKKSKEQIVVRNCLERNMGVIVSLRDIATLSLAFQVYDFKLSENEYADLKEAAG